MKKEQPKPVFFHQILRHLAEMDGKVICAVLGEGLRKAFGDVGFDHIADNLDDKTFSLLVAKISGERDRLAGENVPSIQRNFNPLTASTRIS